MNLNWQDICYRQVHRSDSGIINYLIFLIFLVLHQNDTSRVA